MRLVEVYTKLKDIKTPTFTNNPFGDYYPDNMTWEDIKNSHQDILNLQKESNIILIEDDNIISNIYLLSSNNAVSYTLSEKVNNLFLKLDILKGTLSSIYKESQQEQTINIKLQNNLKNLESFSKTISDINDVLKFLKIKDYKVIGVDKGSNWLEIIINNKEGISLLLDISLKVAGLITAYNVNRKYLGEKKYLKEKISTEKLKQETEKNKSDHYKSKEEYYRTKKISEQLEIAKQLNNEGTTRNSDREQIYALNLKHETDNLIDEISHNFYDEENKPKLNDFSGTELKTAIKTAFYKLLELMEDEVEIHPSLNPPSWLKSDEKGDKFIDYKNINLIEKPKKQIEHKKD